MIFRKPAILFLGFLLLFIVSCSQDESVLKNDSFDFQFPDHFPEPYYQNESNKITKEGITLGKRLFYDPILSSDSSVSCATCHAQVHAFADHGTKLSLGVKNRLGKRNSPAIFNMAWNSSFMWDGGVNHIEVMPLAPIENENEMDENISNIILKLNRNKTYKKLTKDAFDSDTITEKHFLFALAQFMSVMVSADSKYDKYIVGKDELTKTEMNGYQIFKTNCSSCHQEPLMTNFSFKNNGLYLKYDDDGREKITLNVKDKAKFKVPSLRNVELTYPYMHDGSIANLENVIEHYSGNIQPHPSLALELQKPFHFTEKEKKDLINFLKTLTDYQLLSNQLLQEPLWEN